MNLVSTVKASMHMWNEKREGEGCERSLGEKKRDAVPALSPPNALCAPSTDAEKAKMMWKHFSATAKLSMCSQHCFSHKSKTYYSIQTTIQLQLQLQL